MGIDEFFEFLGKIGKYDKIIVVLFVVGLMVFVEYNYFDMRGTDSTLTYSGYGVTFNYMDNFRPLADRNLGPYKEGYFNRNWQKMMVNGKEVQYRTFELLSDLRDDPAISGRSSKPHRESDTVCIFYEFSGVNSTSDLVKSFKTDNIVREKNFVHAPKGDEIKGDVNSNIVNGSSTTVNGMNAYKISYNFQSYYHGDSHDFTGIVTFIEAPGPKYYAIQCTVIKGDEGQFDYYNTIVNTFKVQ